MSKIVKMLGETLTNKAAETVSTATALQGKVVGLYFSAHWCPPCRQFTPMLAKSYKDMKAAGKNLEIVFVSSDKSESQFQEYMAEMPWLALPFDDRATKNALSTKYKVKGIPTLVFLDTDGTTITMDGRSAISQDPQGADFPWKPKSVLELLGNEFVRPGGEVVGREAIDGKTLGLYFSAHWCGPCRAFTPVLTEVYKAMKARADADKFEFVFVSSDRDQKAFEEYHGSMPWLALPFNKRKEKDAISALYEVRGIPTFVTIGPDGEVINKNARGGVDGDREGLQFPWAPKPLVDLSEDVECNGISINDCPALIVFMESSDDLEQKEISEFLLKMAKAEKDATPKGEEQGLLYFTAKVSGGHASQIRKMTNLPDSENPQMVVVDIPNDGGYYVYDGAEDVSESSVKAFVAAFKGKTLKRLQLS